MVNPPQKFRSQNSEKKSVRSFVSVLCVKRIWGPHIFRCADVSPSDKQNEVWWRAFSYKQNCEFSLSKLLTFSLPLRANFLRKKYLKFPNCNWTTSQDNKRTITATKIKLQSFSSIYWVKLPRHNTQKFPLYSLGSHPRSTNFPADTFLGPNCNFHVLPLSCSRSKLLPNSR